MYIASFLSFVSVLQLRRGCLKLNDMFMHHINPVTTIWIPMVTSANPFWATVLTTPKLMECLKRNETTLLELLYIFRYSQALPSLASECICIFAVVKSVTDHAILGVASTMHARSVWEYGQWEIEMKIEWRTDRSAVVQHVVPPNHPNEAGDRWIVKTSIELYMWCHMGMTKLVACDIDLPDILDTGAYGAGEYISEDIQVCLHASTVTLYITDKEPDAEGWYDPNSLFDPDAKMEAVAVIRNEYPNLFQYQPIFEQIKKIVISTP